MLSVRRKAEFVQVRDLRGNGCNTGNFFLLVQQLLSNYSSGWKMENAQQKIQQQISQLADEYTKQGALF